MKLLLGVLGVTLGFEVSENAPLQRSKRQANCNTLRQECVEYVDMGFYETFDTCMDEHPECVAAEEGDGQCQDYNYNGFQLCCPEGLDTDHYWPSERPQQERGPRPLAPNQKCPNGCDVAQDVDQFVCSYFKRVAELETIFNEFEKFLSSDLEEIINFKTQFVRRYAEVNKKGVRSAAKLQKIIEKIKDTIAVVTENDQLIQELEGEVATITAKINKIDLDLTNLHSFCKVGKNCAKKCFFEPELFGGIKKDCAEYYHDSFWLRNGNPSEWQSMPQSGVYIIQPNNRLKPKYVYCDQKTDGGGWTLMQHKGISNATMWDKYNAPTDNPEEPNKYQANWAQNYKAYENGFGWVSCNGETDYWMGLEYMSALSYGKGIRAQLRIDIKDWDHQDYWGYYNRFSIMNAARKYKMFAMQYSGVGSYSIGDAWAGVQWGGEARQQGYTKSNGMAFTTKDQDNDNFCKARGMKKVFGFTVPNYNADDEAAGCSAIIEKYATSWKTNAQVKEWGSCAHQDGAGFWYNRCSAGNLNGKVYNKGYYALKSLVVDGDEIMADHDDGLIWGTMNKGRDYSFMLAEMRIRPANFQSRHKMLQTRRGGSPLEDERKNSKGRG